MTDLITLAPIDADAEVSEFQQYADTALAKVAAVALVKTDEDYTAADTMLGQIKGRQQELEKKRKKIVTPLNEAKDQVQKLFNPVKQLLADAENSLKGGMVTFNRQKREAAAKAQAAADERARKEREALEARAENHEAKGRDERAEALREQADHVHVPQVASAPPKTAGGGHTRVTWQAKVVDPWALLAAVLEGKDQEYPVVPRDAITINMKLLNKQAGALKENFRWPGVVAEPVDSVTAKAR